MYNIVNLFDFQQIINYITEGNNLPWSSTLLYATYHDIYPNAPLWENQASKAYLEDLHKLNFARFYDWFCLESYKDNLSEAHEEMAAFNTKYINILVNTYDKYAGILASFDEVKNKLLAQVKSSTETGYNDTPQDEGDYTDETHRTTYTKVTSLVDGATPIDRLDEITKKIRNIMLEWSNEFKPLFWKE